MGMDQTDTQIYLFASDRHPSVSAFTSDKDGRNLPTAYGPWQPVNSGRALLIGSQSDRIAAAVQADGFILLADASMRALTKEFGLADRVTGAYKGE